MLAYLWAQDQAGLIGKEGKLPWYLPADLKYFKEKTINNAIVMGRKTFEGMGKRPLPNRKNIILTRDKNYEVPADVLVLHDKQAVLDYATNFTGITFITGGSEVFKLFINEVDVLYCTQIHATFSGDAHFPEIDWQQWELTDAIEGIVDEKNLYPHTFEVYKRR